MDPTSLTFQVLVIFDDSPSGDAQAHNWRVVDLLGHRLAHEAHHAAIGPAGDDPCLGLLHGLEKPMLEDLTRGTQQGVHNLACEVG